MTRSSGWVWAAVAAASLVLAYVVVRSAWIADDALITLRSVQNFVDGYGPRWNVADRVQTYTHPLWMLCLSGGTWATGDPIVATHGLGLACSAGAIGLLVFLGRTSAAAILVGVLALLGSRAFVDYSASGLENPMTHLLLGAFALAALAERGASRYPFLVLVASLAMLNRMDTALLVGPTLAITAWQRTRRSGWLRTSRSTLLWSSPLWVWLAFAAVYYGTPLPIAAYAKAFCSGLEATDLAQQAVRYYAWTWHRDPITLVVIAAGLAGALLGVRRLRPLVLGATLYLAYLFRIGGDFMGGRFFAAPMFCAVVCGVVALGRLNQRTVLGLAAGVLCLWWPGAESTIRAARSDFQNRAIADDGIADERGFYYQQFGWFSDGPNQIMPFGTLHLAIAEQRAAGRSKTPNTTIVPGYAIGAMAIWLGRDGYLLDPLLCDPLLARLPGYDLEAWRIGHVKRRLPAGYVASIRSGENQIEDADLRRYWGTLRSVIRDDVFSTARLRALWRLWTGADHDHLERYVRHTYYRPRVDILRAEDLRTPLAAGTPFYDPRVHVLNPAGLRVTWDAPQRATTLQFGLDALDTYRVVFWRGPTEVGTLEVPSGGTQLDGLREVVVPVPTAATQAGFDSLTITSAVSDDAIAALGYLTLQ